MLKPGLALIAAVLTACGASQRSGVEGDCSSVCAARARSGCPNALLLGECEEDCRSTQSQIPATCGDPADELLSCEAQASYACDTSDRPTTTDCEAERADLDACIAGR
jgi:hypothetical protein